MNKSSRDIDSDSNEDSYEPSSVGEGCHPALPNRTVAKNTKTTPSTCEPLPLRVPNPAGGTGKRRTHVDLVMHIDGVDYRLHGNDILDGKGAEKVYIEVMKERNGV
eukprot:TRINITY_DN2059_c0_g2_i14.p1 TRINITY_DN2059_c0_g2~~TRINITY_DN2059_c0_g2_i14.p1  ORF type:complete len:106 (-),score=14.71 TRINITY_DN2059_c0_g2_i14:524-841(-)